MAFLGHFIFELIKIAILSAAYALVLLAVLKVAGRYREGWIRQASGKEWISWLSAYLIIYVGLFGYMFTYWGDHGLGDYARVPVGHWQQIHEIDGTDAYIEGTKYHEGAHLDIEKFALTPDVICAQTQETAADSGGYLVLELSSRNIRFFTDASDYDSYARENSLPLSDTFQKFSYYYRQYWDGWRFWLLP